MPQRANIAVDLGAESGRVVVGRLEGGRLTSDEVHRFRHSPVPTPTGLVWDFTHLWQQVLVGLGEAAKFCAEKKVEPVSVGVDTWAVDWALVSERGGVLGLPGCYRDPAFGGAFEAVCERLGREEIYEATGIQLMPFNTLYQVFHRHGQLPGVFDQADYLLFVPDLLHWMLSGVTAVERTTASTSQMVDTRTGTWNRAFVERLGLPTAMLSEPVDPGTILGGLRAEVAEATGLSVGVKVVAPPTHDTASAIAAVPAQAGTSWCYLSSGTWSLLGAELDEPCITAASGEANFTNELGLGGTVRFLKNIAGLWLVQEVRRQLEREGESLDYDAITQAASQAQSFETLIPVNDPAFAPAGGMIDRIARYAKQTGQPVPEGVGPVVRCCLESLALQYRGTLETMERLLDRRFEVMHIVGGGGRNALLNRMAADATGRRVVVGPEEGTAMGNLLTQAMGLGEVADLAELRRVVRDSTELVTVEPDAAAAGAWGEAAARYGDLPAAAF